MELMALPWLALTALLLCNAVLTLDEQRDHDLGDQSLSADSTGRKPSRQMTDSDTESSDSLIVNSQLRESSTSTPVNLTAGQGHAARPVETADGRVAPAAAWTACQGHAVHARKLGATTAVNTTTTRTVQTVVKSSRFLHSTRITNTRVVRDLKTGRETKVQRDETIECNLPGARTP